MERDRDERPVCGGKRPGVGAPGRAPLTGWRGQSGDDLLDLFRQERLWHLGHGLPDHAQEPRPARDSCAALGDLRSDAPTSDLGHTVTSLQATAYA